jgi:hypothetical protein
MTERFLILVFRKYGIAHENIPMYTAVLMKEDRRGEAETLAFVEAELHLDADRWMDCANEVAEEVADEVTAA